MGDDEAALRRAYIGKVGLALSGGGFRASLFHLGVLAKLAERDVLRNVEILSCVSGGSTSARSTTSSCGLCSRRWRDRHITPRHYVDLVGEMAGEFLDAIQHNLRVRLTQDIRDNWKMMSSSQYSRTDRAPELLEELIFSQIPRDSEEDAGKPWRMTDLFGGFSPRYENWRREAKVPVLVLNATTLNSSSVEEC